MHHTSYITFTYHSYFHAPIESYSPRSGQAVEFSAIHNNHSTKRQHTSITATTHSSSTKRISTANTDMPIRYVSRPKQTLALLNHNCSSPPTKADAFEEFKRERGSEINRIFVENKSEFGSKFSQISVNWVKWCWLTIYKWLSHFSIQLGVATQLKPSLNEGWSMNVTFSQVSIVLYFQF